MISGARPGRRFPRWVIGVAVVLAAIAGIYLDVRNAPPVYPSTASLAREGVSAVPVSGSGNLSPEEALSSAESDGLAGGSMAVRLVRLDAFGYRGRAWEVSATHAQYQPLSGPAVKGDWVVLFFNPEDGRLLGFAVVNR